MTREAMELGLGPVDSMDDLFRIEKAVKETRNDLRTPKMRAFAARMQHVRAVAAEHIARTLAEDTAAAFHVDIEGARDKAARQVVEFTDKAHDLQDAASTLRAGGNTAQADAAQAAADDAQQKADAVVAGAQSVTNPPPPPLAPRTRRWHIPFEAAGCVTGGHVAGRNTIVAGTDVRLLLLLGGECVLSQLGPGLGERGCCGC